MSKNTDRAERASRALKAYIEAFPASEYVGEGLHIVLSDLLADLLHYTHLNNMEFEQALDMAYINFDAEREEEPA